MCYKTEVINKLKAHSYNFDIHQNIHWISLYACFIELFHVSLDKSDIGLLIAKLLLMVLHILTGCCELKRYKLNPKFFFCFFLSTGIRCDQFSCVWLPAPPSYRFLSHGHLVQQVYWRQNSHVQIHCRGPGLCSPQALLEMEDHTQRIWTKVKPFVYIHHRTLCG